MGCTENDKYRVCRVAWRPCMEARRGEIVSGRIGAGMCRVDQYDSVNDGGKKKGEGYLDRLNEGGNGWVKIRAWMTKRENFVVGLQIRKI